MDIKQRNRYERMRHEKIFFLNLELASDVITFAISGSTCNVYQVKLDIQQRTIACDCPDMKQRHNGIICKHCCFVISKMLGLYCDTEHEFWTKRRFTEEDIKTIMTMIRQFRPSEECVNQRLLESYQSYQKMKLCEKSPEEKRQMENIRQNENCIICFDQLEIEDTTSLFECGMCRNIVHLGCISQWLSKNSHQNCVYCRQPVRLEKKSQNSTGEYINLAVV